MTIKEFKEFLEDANVPDDAQLFAQADSENPKIVFAGNEFCANGKYEGLLWRADVKYDDRNNIKGIMITGY